MCVWYFYSSFTCQFVDLELGKLGNMYGLLRFPKIAELRGKVPNDFVNVDCDINDLQYK